MNVWTIQKDFEYISMKEWEQLMDGITEGLNTRHDRYLEIGSQYALNGQDEDTVNMCADSCANCIEALDFNKKLRIRERAEFGYNTYGKTHDGLPTIDNCSKEEFNDIYDKNLNVKLPKYLV